MSYCDDWPCLPMSRRRLLQALGVGALLPVQALWATASDPGVLVSATGMSPENYGVGWTASTHSNLQSIVSGFRGHGIARHPTRRASVLLFARRPGTQVLEINLTSGTVEREFHASPDCHLFGHGCFSQDRTQLYTTEANPDQGDGKVVVRNADTYEIMHEFSSHGIEPHELSCLPDGNTLVVANGGIQTHPDSGRTPLNLDSMASSLCFIDSATGECKQRVTVPEPKASIRHVSVAHDGTVAFAMQMQRASANHTGLVPLAGFYHAKRGLTLAEHPDVVIARLNDYVGSVAIHPETGLAGFTSPRGDLAAFWHRDGKFAGHHALHDVCGITLSNDNAFFILTSSNGSVHYLHHDTLQEDPTRRQLFANASWDNHAIMTSL